MDKSGPQIMVLFIAYWKHLKMAQNDFIFNSSCMIFCELEPLQVATLTVVYFSHSLFFLKKYSICSLFWI